MGKRLHTLLRACFFAVSSFLFLCIPVSAIIPSSSFIEKFDSSNIAQKRNFAISTEAGPDGGKDEIFRFEVTQANFSCTEDKCEHYYNSCRLELDYNITSLLHSTTSQETEIRCSAIISYQTEGGDSLKCESDSEAVFHKFKGQETCLANIHVDFHFSYYEEVNHAHLESVECHIHHVPG